MELRRSEPDRRPHLVDQRRAKVPGALSKLEIPLRHARNPGRNSRCTYAEFVIRAATDAKQRPGFQSKFVNRLTIHDARMGPPLILFAFVFLRRHNPVLNPVGMKHRCGEIEEKQAKAPAGGSERSEENQNADWDGANQSEKTRPDVS